MKNQYILLFFIIILLSACNNNYEYCTENWFKTEGNYLIQVSSNSCKTKESSDVRLGKYAKVKDKWYLVEYSHGKGDCHFMKMCTYNTNNYYLISDDKDHFTPLEYGYSKDRKNVYYQQYLIENADPDTFKILDKEEYSVDHHSVYYRGKVILSADPKSFKILNDYYSIDSQFAFVKDKKIVGANSKNFIIFEQKPENLQGLWAHDNTYLYYYNQKIPIQLDIAKFRYIAANIYTDGKKVVELNSTAKEAKNTFIQREDLTLPLKKLSNSSLIDGKHHLFINTKQGTVKQVPHIDGRYINPIHPTCPIKQYPYLTLDCEEALKISADHYFFEDDKYVYIMSSKRDYVFDLEPIFKKEANKPIYLFVIGYNSNLLHNRVLYTSITVNHRQQSPRNFTSTKIEGDLVGPFPSSSNVLADNAGFISLNTISDKNPNMPFRSFTKEEFGVLHLAKKQFSDAYVLENDRYFFIMLKERSPQHVDNLIVDKQNLTVKFQHFNNDITEDSAELLKQLGLTK